MASTIASKFSIGVSSCTLWVGPMIRPPPRPSVARRVRTGGCVRSFQTLRDEWPRTMPGGALLIVDVAGDLYRVPDPAALDKKSRKRLAAFVG